MQPTRKCNFCHVEKTVESFLKDNRRGTVGWRCKECRRDKAREWRKSRPDYEKQRYELDKMKKREGHLLRKYGNTSNDYNEMLASQGGCCAICRKNRPGGRSEKFNMDHCHKTGKIRGLLCMNCNRMLGHALDTPEILEAGADYLNAQAAQTFIESMMEITE